MSNIGIIPARYASSRFPGKPLVSIQGKPMIWHTYQSASKCKSLDKVIVATDDERIKTECHKYNIPCVITDVNHSSGTERCAEVAAQFHKNDIIVNIQGDEPFISTQHIEALLTLFEHKQTKIGTLIKKITDSEELFNPNRPKVVTNKKGKALLFSRTAIPFIKDLEKEKWVKNFNYFKHIGLYGYKNAVLQKIVKLAPSEIELKESLEQLRWLSNGYNIYTHATDIESVSIDTPDDLDKLLLTLK